MRTVYVWIIGAFVFLCGVNYFYFPISPNGSVNTKIVRAAIKNCFFISSNCQSNIFLRDMTDFEWDTAYLIPYNFSPRGYLRVDESNLKILSTLDFLQFSFFLRGKEVHYELFSYGSPNWFSILDPDTVPSGNQVIFFDSPIDNPVNELGTINFPESSKYFECSHNSSLKIKKFLPAKGQWPGKVILVTPESCDVKYADATPTTSKVPVTPPITSSPAAP